MAWVQVNLRLTEDEKELLTRRAKKEDVSEIDHMRTCLVMDALVAGDLAAMKIVGQRLREKLKERLTAWSQAGII